MQTKTAFYDTRSAAEVARDELVARGLPESGISIRGADTETTTGTTATEDQGFWSSLADLFMPDDDRDTYAEGMRRGGYLLSVQVPDGLEDEVEDVLESSEPIDLDERAETWRQDGWTSQSSTRTATVSEVPGAAYAEASGTAMPSAYATTTAASTAAVAASDPARLGTDANYDETVELVEEELKVGKREVGGGKVRIRTYVTETPVEEDISLRSERVTIERRAVDREVTPGVAAFQEKTIEAVERGEQAVVSKTARVKEEINLRKDVETHTETVRDTVRSTDVEIDDERSEHGLVSDPLLKRDPDKI